MKQRSIIAALTFLIVAAGCRSEVDRHPAAQVTEPLATATTGTEMPVSGTQPTPGATVGKVIKEKSSIEWVGAKVTRDHLGRFRDFDGWIEYQRGAPSRIAFDIELTSVESDEEKLTAHLKTADFFDVARYPKATFVSSSLTEAPSGPADGTTHSVTGRLNLHGVEKEVIIPVKAEVTADGVRTTSQFTINRHDWGISYRGMADDLIRDSVLIKLDLMFPPPPSA